MSIAIGHLFHKHRVAWSIGAYIGINILQSVLMSVFFQIMNRFDWHWMNRLFENIAPAWRAHIIMLVLIACAAIPAAIFFFGTDWILKNKLKVLSDTVEEYRATDNAMRKTLLAAQQMADNIVDEAKKKQAEMVGEAESDAHKRVDALKDR